MLTLNVLVQRETVFARAGRLSAAPMCLLLHDRLPVLYRCGTVGTVGCRNVQPDPLPCAQLVSSRNRVWPTDGLAL